MQKETKFQRDGSAQTMEKQSEERDVDVVIVGQTHLSPSPECSHCRQVPPRFSGQFSDEFLKKQIPSRRNVSENVQWPSFSAPFEQIWQYSATSSLHLIFMWPLLGYLAEMTVTCQQ
jgi:hypothetical protein